MQLSFFLVCLVLSASVVTSQLSFPSSIVSQLQYNQANQSLVPLSSSPIDTNIRAPISSSTDRYLVGNLSESFSFDVAPPSIKVTYLGLNGYSLFILGVGFSNKSKFNYDEKMNRLTILSLDLTTVGYYSAVDGNWQTFITIVSAINVSSFQIENYRVSENENGSSLVSCSISIIRSTFQLTEISSQTTNPSKLTGTENLPHLDLFISTRTQFSTHKMVNDTLNGHNLTRTITIQRSLTRADHNGTVQCQVESNNNLDIYLIKRQSVDIQYGPNLETGAAGKVHLESEILKIIAMECQIEGNPNPSYVWYDIGSNISTGLVPVYGQYSVQPSTAGQNVFGTTKEIQRIYQYPGQYSMQCQAQSNGRTIRQEFLISALQQSNSIKSNLNLDEPRQKSNKIPMVIGFSIAAILLLLVVAIVIAVIIFVKRQKSDPNGEDSITDKTSNDKSIKSRWGSLPIDYSKYKHDSLKGDSSSTSHLVESVENTSIQIVTRPSPLATSANSSYRQTPSAIVSLSYRQASALPGFRSLAPTHSNCFEHDDVDEMSRNIIVMPSILNRSRPTTPFGSHKSLSESIQSFRSTQQTIFALPMKKRSHELPTPKRDDKTPSPESCETTKTDYENHHYQNPEQLRVQQQIKTENNSSEEQIEAQSQRNPSFNVDENARTTLGSNQLAFPSVDERRIQMSPLPSKLIVDKVKEKHPDEIPPSYHQVAHRCSPLNAFVYHEPTEV